MKKTRNSGIELLRILAAVGVVILHYNNDSIGGGFGFVTQGSLNQYWLFLTETLFIVAVNVFVMVSGYFLCNTNRRRLEKVIDLMLQVIIFSVGYYLICVLTGSDTWSVKRLIYMAVPAKYFVVLYCTLYIISPYINICLNKLSKANCKKLILTLVLLFSVYSIAVDYLEAFTSMTFSGLSTVGMSGTESGCSIVNFALLYIVGAYISKYKVTFKTSALVKMFVLLVGIVYVMSLFEMKLGIHFTAWGYDDPLLILLAAVILMIFARMQFRNGVINELAGAALTCYLVNDGFLPLAGIEQAVQSNIVFMAVHQICTGSVIYLASYVLYKIYRMIMRYPDQWIASVCGRCNLTVEEDNI